MPLPFNSKPFLVRLERRDETLAGRFRPAASVSITPALRTSGLLLALSGEELRHLLLLLTFAHPNGHIQPSIVEIANALQLSHRNTRAVMQTLLNHRWQGHPLVYEISRESGLDGYIPSPAIIGTVQDAARQVSENPDTWYRAASREEVIRRSRAAYTRPRADVERDIALLNGWAWPFKTIAEATADLARQATPGANAPPEQPHDASHSSVTHPPMEHTDVSPSSPELRSQLLALGMPNEQADSLLARFDPERIRRQMQWLHLRRPHNPARLLAAAIERDYEAPPGAADRSLPHMLEEEPATNASTAATDDLQLPIP